MEDRYALPYLKVTGDDKWRKRAQCRNVDTSVFYGNDAHRKGKLVCVSCVVKDDCLQFALDNDISEGVYGGYTPKERKALAVRVEVTVKDLTNA
jgi:WhiB family redox-sensing transcriptional regulator